MKELTILHTSDWHLGHQFHKQNRDDEFTEFFNWMIAVCEKYKVDAVIIAGDVFNTSAPGTTNLSAYYKFMVNLAQTGVRHVIVTAGNHDSPAIINLAHQLLKFINVHVVGASGDNPETEIKILNDADGEPELIVCAVPYLRDRDLRNFIPGATTEENDANLLAGIRKHYQKLADYAENIRANRQLPVIATGHLYVHGSVAHEDEKKMYRGNLVGMPIDIFPESFDYMALGHIHRPQIIGNNPTRRYSGSPIPMSFEEATHDKSVFIIKFSGKSPQIQTIPVPSFQIIKTVAGNFQQIEEALLDLKKSAEQKIWLEIQYTGNEFRPMLYQDLLKMVENSQIEILSVKNIKSQRTLTAMDEIKNLDEITPEKIFLAFLENEKPDMEQEARNRLLETFNELIMDYNEQLRERDNENS